MTGKILCSEEDTKNDEVLHKIYICEEAINSIMAERTHKGVATGTIEVNGPVLELLMLF